MPDLYKSFIVRPAEQLTKKQIDTVAIKTHPVHLQSSRFLGWVELLKQDNLVDLKTQLTTFLQSQDVINTFDKFPKSIKGIIEYAEYHGFEFNLEELKLSNTDVKDKKPEPKQDVRQDIKTAYTNIADQMLAESIIGNITPKKQVPTFDKQAVLKTLHLLEFVQAKGNERISFNVRKVYEKPILLPQEFYEIDWCTIKHSLPKENLKDQIELLIKENAIRVVQGREGNTTVPTLTEEQFVNLIISLGKKLGISPRGVSVADLSNLPLEKINELNLEIIEFGRNNKNLIERNYPTPTLKKNDPCNCTCDETCVEQSFCCAKIAPYVADLYVVREEMRGYEVSEMSYIENIIKSEVKERIHRDLEREEIETQHEEEQTSFEQKEHQVDEKFSLQKEIEKQLESEVSIDAGVVAHQKWGTGAVSGDITATANFGYNQSKKDAQKTVQDNAKQVIDKSISSLQKKVRDLSIRKIFKEIEETNKHSFGGISGADNNISQQFYYVNQIKRGQVFNWGKRELIDLYLPEPSELYKRLTRKKFGKKEPKFPQLNNEDLKPDKITSANYLDLIKEYKIKEYEIPKQNKTIDYNPNWSDWGVGWKRLTDIYDLVVEEGYEATSMKVIYKQFSSNPAGKQYGHYSIVHNNNNLNVSEISDAHSTLSSTLPNLTGTNRFITESYCFEQLNIIIRFTCEISKTEKFKWQLGIYNNIIEAYEKELAAYNAALAEFKQSNENIYNQNPFKLLQDIQEQLKQAGISYISCQFFDDMDAMKQNVMPCGFPQPDLRESQKEGDFVRFFEQAFEWKFMNFIFYPYFWSRKCTWEKKMKEEADNMLFQRFLKAGFVRISIPVRQGFEAHVNWYLKTRQIWSDAGAPSAPGSDFLPIIQELKEDKDNFNTDREGLLVVTNGQPEVNLINSDYYWNIGNPSSSPIIPPHVDKDRINADLNREIFIDCIQYKIINIRENTNDATHKTWIITLDKPYVGDSSAPNPNSLPWSTGAVFVGAPWEFRVPTKLVWMRTDGNDLPKKHPF